MDTCDSDDSDDNEATAFELDDDQQRCESTSPYYGLTCPSAVRELVERAVPRSLTFEQVRDVPIRAHRP